MTPEHLATDHLDRGHLEGTVLVAIPTFRRPARAAELLDRLPEALRGQQVQVLLLDNDPEGSAVELTAHPALQQEGWSYRHTGMGDVSSVRNLALQAALERGAVAVAMLDDDELPSRGWLGELVRVGRETGADVVAGPVRQEQTALDHPWVAAALGRAEHREGVLYEGDVGTGNVLLTTGLLQRTGLRFDPALGRSGGEDTLFFRQARAAGAVIAWAPGAAVVERNQADRLTRAALVRRIYRNGRSSQLVDRLTGAERPLWHRGVSVAGVGALGIARAVAARVRGDRVEPYRQVFRLARHTGRLVGAPRGRTLDGDYGA